MPHHVLNVIAKHPHGGTWKEHRKWMREVKLIPDLDIYRTGNILVKQHGEDAPSQAAMMPSLDNIELANQNKTGKNAGRYNFALANQNGAGVWVPRSKGKPFANNFALLTEEAPA